MKSAFLGLMSALLVGVVLVGCADDGPRSMAVRPPAAPASTAAQETVTVQAIDNVFSPERVEVPVGTEVVWVNRGHNEHDLLSDFGFGVDAANFGPGDEYRHVFTEPGEYPYYCTIHGTHTAGMIGTIVVTAGD